MVMTACRENPLSKRRRPFLAFPTLFAEYCAWLTLLYHYCQVSCTTVIVPIITQSPPMKHFNIIAVSWQFHYIGKMRFPPARSKACSAWRTKKSLKSDATGFRKARFWRKSAGDFLRLHLVARGGCFTFAVLVVKSNSSCRVVVSCEDVRVRRATRLYPRTTERART